MISYNETDRLFEHKIKKELWTKDELKDFASQVQGDTVRTKYGVPSPKAAADENPRKTLKAQDMRIMDPLTNRAIA